MKGTESPNGNHSGLPDMGTDSFCWVLKCKKLFENWCRVWVHWAPASFPFMKLMEDQAGSFLHLPAKARRLRSVMGKAQSQMVV
eukprot:s616_g15.t2